MSRLGVLPMLPMLLALVGSACAGGHDGGGDDAEGGSGFVGAVEGTDAFVGLLVGQEGAVAYVCNGDEALAEWFEGAIDDPEGLSLSNAHGASLSANADGEGYAGEVTLADGSRHAFSAHAVGPEAGIYRVLGDEAEAAEIHAGWILDDDGEQRGALRLRSTFQPTPTFEGTDVVIESTTYPVYQFRTPAAPGPVPVPYPIIGGSTKPKG